MSRSYKKAIIKDRPRNHKKSSLYWRKIRSRVNQQVRKITKFSANLIDIDRIDVEDEISSGKAENPVDETTLPQRKVIYNDYDYCDYKFDYEHDRDANKEVTKKHRRK